MAILQRFGTDRYKFTFGIGSPTAFGKPFNGRWPEYILLPPSGTLYHGLYLLIGNNGYPFHKSLIIGNGFKPIFFTDLGFLGYGQQLVQDLILYFLRVFQEKLYLMVPFFQQP